MPARRWTPPAKIARSRSATLPLTSVLVAGLIGYVLHFLPIGLIVRLKIRIFLALLKPALFLFGAYKLYEFISAQVQANSRPLAEGAHEPVIDSPTGPTA